ncbi:hypothetical protein KY285_006032 [Solanum tuberosum]|nr:hypothetical protein KY289_006528 [Solanum tuberosum]KAH0752884.1 hypothetical protein KY285_006032 [Solanum tuberosum]
MLIWIYLQEIEQVLPSVPLPEPNHYLFISSFLVNILVQETALEASAGSTCRLPV